jgi:protein-arginine kinase activator protein McsA
MDSLGKNTDNINRLLNPTQCVNADENRENRGFLRNAFTQCVIDEEKSNHSPDKASWKIGICKHCGETFEKRTTWQLFCREQCRLDFHGVTSIAQLYKKKRK